MSALDAYDSPCAGGGDDARKVGNTEVGELIQ